MLDYLKPLEKNNYDTFIFVPDDEDETKMTIRTSEYKNPGENVGHSDYGPCYDIILFKENDEGGVKNLERFDAILTSPLEYMSMLIPQSWFGAIFRKTTTSTPVADSLFATLSKI
jgi:hypothetical protein